MNRKHFIIILSVILAAAIAFSAILLERKRPTAPEPPTPPATPDSPPQPRPQPTKPSPTKAGDAAETTAETEPDVESAEEADFFATFADFPGHFISHDGGPIEDGSLYMHATIEVSSDGTMSGEFFSNMESSDDKTVEHKSSWTGKIRGNKIYRTETGSYFFYVDKVKYEKKPNTEDKKDGKSINYVYGFGLDPDRDNRVDIFPPGTPIDSLNTDDAQTDVRQFLSMMFKDGEAETLDCYLIRGVNNNCYISITDEEANMEPPSPPDQPDQPEQPQPPQ